MEENPVSGPSRPEKSKTRKYIINLSVIFIVAIVFTVVTLLIDDNFNQVLYAFSQANLWMIALILGLMMVILFIEGLILFILARLYTTRYSVKRGISNHLVGLFFSHITPSGSGGQFAQAYIFKKQGIDVASAASILVMQFLLFQIVQVIFGVLALIFRLNRFFSITEAVVIGNLRIPILYLSLLGFLVNFLIIFGIIVLTKSRFIHQKVINGIVGFFGKIRLIKNPEKVKSNLYVQVENFRIESKRLRSNTAVTSVLVILLFIRMTIGNAIPYLSAYALPTINLSQTNLLDGIFMTAYLNVIIYFAPLPGAVGFSEFFFSYLFQSFFGGFAQTLAPQLIWRGVTFYLTLILGAISLVAFRIGHKEDFFKAQTTSFVDLQKSTIELRKQTAEIMFNTGEMSTVNLRHRFSKMAKDFFGFKHRKVDRYGKVIHTEEVERKSDKDKPKGS